MDRQLIKTLIDALESSDLTELEYSRDGTTLRLVKGGAMASARAPRSIAPMVPATTAPLLEPAKEKTDGLIRAPLYGVAHLQRTPGAVPFVITGQAVEAGQVVCTIEAMKVFTDVRADRAGTVIEILVTTAQEVEAGQPLVRLG